MELSAQPSWKKRRRQLHRLRRRPAETSWPGRCAACSKAHVGAVNVNSKRCEDCKLTQPSFGLLAEGKKRWCVYIAGSVEFSGCLSREILAFSIQTL